MIGGGGREHTLVWKVRQSPRVEKVYCAPGNGGISQMAECVSIAADDIERLLAFAGKERIDLTIVGPEGPLTLGIADRFRAAGLAAFGPGREAANIEGSKVFAKDLMARYGISSAGYATFSNSDEARCYIKKHGVPCVVKAEGLAAGKGVVVAHDQETALEAVRLILEERAFGAAGNRVVVEEYLEGEEVSVLAFTDGRTVVPMVPAQDHKRVFDNDQGPNTGGMGAYSPVPVYDQGTHQTVVERILLPTVQALAAEGILYTGVLYAGLMLTGDGPKVLEFNARFGDPETQVVLPRLKTDLVDIMEAVNDGHLDKISIEWNPEAAVCVVMAAGGYPGSYTKGDPIQGLEGDRPGVMAFHAGTKWNDGVLVTDGGRILGVTALGSTLAEAQRLAYAAVDGISFKGMHYRRDIGSRALVTGKR